jgi:hypothetical protein
LPTVVAAIPGLGNHGSATIADFASARLADLRNAPRRSMRYALQSQFQVAISLWRAACSLWNGVPPKEAIMSVAGILSSAVFGIGALQFSSRMHKAHSEFQQLGQDLQSGNLSAAQTDFSTLQQLQGQRSSSSSTQSSSSISKDFNQLAADLKAGNLTAAQQDFTAVQKDVQTQLQATHHHHHHHSTDSDGSNAVGQLFSQLGQALQSGNLSTAQQAYAALQQDFSQYASVNASPTQSSTSSVSLTA